MASFFKYTFGKNLLAEIILVFVSSCASVQSPTGGPRDTIPPTVIEENPKNLTRNFADTEIQIQFNEFIKLTNEFSEISISPALDVLPEFKAKKENLEIKFTKPLEENTTYTVNFGKAISDVNESNILKNYTYVFATGNQIDSLSLSGNVISSLTKEKLKDVTVFIFPVSQDTLFGKKRASFFTTTDTAGNFSLKNLREDTYRIYALNEQGGGDRIYNGPNEEIGFLSEPIVLSKSMENVRLEVFKAVPKVFSIADRKIENDGRILLTFNKPLLKPSIRILEPPELQERKTVEISHTRDTALIWIPELTFDSLKLAIAEGETPVDTVTLRRTKRDTYNRTVLVTDNVAGPRLRPRSDIVLRLSSPIATAQSPQITLLEDSVNVQFELTKQTASNRTFNLKYPWKLNKEYILRVNDNAFTDIYGNKSKLYIKRFHLDTDENYGNLSVRIIVPDTLQSYIAQWINEKTVLREDIITNNTTLNYLTYPTAKYRIRIIYDENKNGIWDSGNVFTRQQPEKSWTFEKIISLRPNWDLEETITIPKPGPQ